jgi:hypothetical protein
MAIRFCYHSHYPRIAEVVVNEDAGIARKDTLDSLEFAVAALGTATPYVGFRIWRLVDGVLCSPHRHERWDQPVLEASCRYATGGADRETCAPLRIAHRSPDPRCGCGIYVSDAPNIAFSHVDFRGVTGIVTVWGALVREEDGARAEFARVAALGLYAHWTARQTDAVKAAARRLEADVVDIESLDRVALRYGARLPARSSA